MRITDDVDIPDKLIDAAADGSLVLFVGAGVSRNQPSSLPLFDGLAERLAELQGENYDRSDPPDAFVGRLCDTAPVVREQARAIISSPASLPNSGHRAIVRLANASAAFRVVTTNYDEHLTTAATGAGIDVGDIYHGPAVPLGRDFSGVVHLHGRVSRSASELVLTDDDFGRAYLTDGWARTFVQDLFLNRTVLFIGYSHGDSVMKYLARGLPPTTSRFALTEIPHDRKWKDLGITPVSYPDNNDHAALTAVLDAWASQLEMGHLDHRARVREIVSSPPSKLPVEADYITHAVTTPTGVRAFTDEARGEAWLRWAEGQQIFKNLFLGGACATDESRILANWFVERYVSDPGPDSVDLGFRTLARLGPVVCDELMRALSRAVYFLGKTSPEEARKWSIVITCAIRTHAGGTSETLNTTNGVLSGRWALPHLRRATQPRLQLSEDRPWFVTETATEPLSLKGTIRWPSTQAEIEHLWDSVRDELPTLGTAVLQIFEQALRDAHDILASFNGDAYWDSWNFSRSAIEPHEQDSFRDYESTLIDGLRDAGTLLSSEEPSLIKRWLSDEHALFRRIGIHLLTETPTLSSQEKLRILLEGRHVFDHDLKHEVYRLLASITPDLNDEARKTLLESILSGPTGFDDEPVLHQRVIFDLTEWLSRYVQNWPELETAVTQIREDRPGIGVREHPDFDHWMESGTWGGSLPFDVDEFIGLIESKGTSEAIQQLENRDYSERHFNEPTWDDACSLLRQVVAKRPDLGASLLTTADSDDWNHRDDLIASAIRGLSDASLPDKSIRDAIQAITPFADKDPFTRPLSEFCLSKVQKVEMREPATLDDLDDLAESIWSSHAQTFGDQDSEDWMMLGLNTWPGFLAQYWVNRIRLRWRAHPDDWHGLSERERAKVLAMLETDADAGKPVLAVLAYELYFFFAADPAYTAEVLFPVFDSSLSERAAHAWRSYMHHPRATDSLLDAGFWDLLQTSKQVITDSENKRDESRYWWLIASICVRSSARTINRQELIDRLAGQPQDLVSFIDALADALADAKDLEAEQAWRAWIREAVQRRVGSPPGVQTDGEKAAWGDMALRLGTTAAEAVTLCDKAPGPLGSRTTFKDVQDSELHTHADLIVSAITRRMNVTPSTTDWHIEHQIGELMTRLAGTSVDETLLRQMVERAITIGVHNAAGWLR